MSARALSAGHEPGRRRDRRLLVAGIAAVAVAVGVGAGILVRQLRAGGQTSGAGPVTAHVVSMRHGLYGEASWAAGSRSAPPITTLTDQHGRSFSLASLHGHTVAIVFFDSHCRQECPLEGRALAYDEAQMPASQRPELVVVSVNPADTRRSVDTAIREWGLAKVAPWYWLMGSRSQLAPVWSAYHIQVAPAAGGDIAHTEALYLVDRRGYMRSAYLWPFAGRFVIHDMRTLALRGPHGV